MTEMIICGLTSFEKKIIKLHKGECKWCMNYFDEQDKETGEWIPCTKKHYPNLNNDCIEWVIDTR